jgi:outer membrane lipoprotein-sorting protein
MIIKQKAMRLRVATFFLTLFPVFLHAQQLDEILQAYYEAAGQEKMGKIETIITTGKNVYSMGGIESGFTIYQARPDKIRVESKFKGSTVVQTYNGKTGWMVAPTMGIPEPKEMSSTELKSLLSQAEFENPLWDYAERGSSLELIETGADYPADHVRLMQSSGDVLHLFIDKKSHLVSSIRSTRVMGGSETEITTLLQNYKSTRGIPMARKIQTRMNGETITTIEIDKIEFNKKIDTTLFEKPLMVPSPVHQPDK